MAEAPGYKINWQKFFRRIKKHVPKLCQQKEPTLVSNYFREPPLYLSSPLLLIFPFHPALIFSLLLLLLHKNYSNFQSWHNTSSNPMARTTKARQGKDEEYPARTGFNVPQWYLRKSSWQLGMDDSRRTKDIQAYGFEGLGGH